MILKIEDQRSPKDQDQFEIDLDHPKDQDHKWWSWRSRSKIVILPISGWRNLQAQPRKYFMRICPEWGSPVFGDGSQSQYAQPFRAKLINLLRHFRACVGGNVAWFSQMGAAVNWNIWGAFRLHPPSETTRHSWIGAWLIFTPTRPFRGSSIVRWHFWFCCIFFC